MRFLLFICISILFIGCNFSQAQKTKLIKLDSYSIGKKVKEPSGLAFDGQFLYTVSDSKSYVYKYSTNGKFLERFNTNLSNLEGISSFGKNTLLLAVETTNTLVSYNYKDKTSVNHKMKFKLRDKSGNSGIEGVTYDPKNNRIYFLNEKNPGALITCNSSSFKVSNELKLEIANDYSGIFYVSDTNELWITSDKESLIYRCSIIGEVIEVIDPKINKKDKLEGIALDYNNNLLFLVTDAGQKLIKYKIDLKK